jgi:hypothetical protein
MRRSGVKPGALTAETVKFPGVSAMNIVKS